MEVTVKKSSMIRPAAPTPSQYLWCTSLDLHMALWKHVDIALFYKPNGSPDFFQPRALKEALSKVLVPFYPAAGRLGRDDESGRTEIVCNAEGALFVEAEATGVLDEFDHIGSSSKLVPFVDYSETISSYPLVLIQVTSFKCGGISIGARVHHALIDGSSLFHFMTSWCDMVRGKSAGGVSPFNDRAIIKYLVPPEPAFHHVEFDPPPSMNMPELSSTTMTTMVVSVKISKIQINELRAKSNKIGENRKYSTYCILAAHIWRCLTKARGLPNNQATKLKIPVDGRFKLKHPPLPSGYFGNVIVETSEIALAGDLLSEPFAKTVERIHEAMNQLDDAYVRSAVTCLEDLVIDPVWSVHEENSRKSPNVCINDLSRLPLHKVDFGWGAPIFMGQPRPVPGIIYMVPPRSVDDNKGGVTLVADLETSSMKFFQELVGLKPVSKL